jgi:hypothetical protein
MRSVVSSPVKPIGGEPPWRAEPGTFSYLTDSGRSSIRLALLSGFLDKRFLLPDFNCDVVPQLFDRLGVSYAFYRVRDDLTIDPDSLAGKTFDVLYVVNYFGQRQHYRDLVSEDTWIMEDCVFLHVVERPPLRQRWIGFNSFRKISPLADGSLIRSTVELNGELIDPSDAPFVAAKLTAKRRKWDYLYQGRHDEDAYLREFERAEAVLDEQTRIHSISRPGLFQLLDFYRNLNREQRARRRNWLVLDRFLFRQALGVQAEHPTLYVLSVEGRDELRRYLHERRIFLPVHWPDRRGSDNILYRSVISIPVDGRYGGADMRRVAAAILDFYGASARTSANMTRMR